MDVATEELCLQKIGELVYDEDKIVTATWLSRNLNISTADCKRLLEQFVRDRHDLNKDDLTVTYVLCGRFKDCDNKLGVLLMKDTDLASKRALFKKLTSESICSIQKGKKFDLDIIGLEYASELNNPEEKPLSGSIIDENCIKREIRKRVPVETVKNDAKRKPDLFANVPKNPQSNDVQKNDSKEETKPQKLPTKKNAPSGIGSYFSKAQNESGEIKMETIKPEKVAEPSLEVNEKKRNKPAGDDREVQPKKSKRSKTQNTNKKDLKKRKRIVEADSSDSDDIFGNVDESEGEEINIKDDSEEEEKPRPVIKVDLNAPKNKRRKLVNQTYTDEDGYILTKKEWVYVSGDESDNEKDVHSEKPQKEPLIQTESKPEEVKVPMKKTNSNGDVETASVTKSKGKKSNKKATNQNQPTLLNFFKSK